MTSLKNRLPSVALVATSQQVKINNHPVGSCADVWLDVTTGIRYGSATVFIGILMDSLDD